MEQNAHFQIFRDPSIYIYIPITQFLTPGAQYVICIYRHRESRKPQYSSRGLIRRDKLQQLSRINARQSINQTLHHHIPPYTLYISLSLSLSLNKIIPIVLVCSQYTVHSRSVASIHRISRAGITILYMYMYTRLYLRWVSFDV